MKKLKLCPFCGHHARIFKDSYGRYNIQCNICGNGTITYNKLECAVAAWERRKNDNEHV